MSPKGDKLDEIDPPGCSGSPIGGNPDPGSADEREVDRRPAPLERGASEGGSPMK